MHAYDCAELIGLLWQWYIRPCVIASLTINNCAQAIYHAKEAGYRLRVLFFLLARKCIQKDDTVLCVVYACFRMLYHSYIVQTRFVAVHSKEAAISTDFWLTNVVLWSNQRLIDASRDRPSVAAGTAHMSRVSRIYRSLF